MGRKRNEEGENRKEQGIYREEHHKAYSSVKVWVVQFKLSGWTQESYKGVKMCKGEGEVSIEEHQPVCSCKVLFQLFIGKVYQVSNILD